MHLVAPQLATQNDLSVSAAGVKLKNAVGQIKADCGSLLYGWRLGLGSDNNPIMAHCDAGSRSHSPHQWRVDV